MPAPPSFVLRHINRDIAAMIARTGAPAEFPLRVVNCAAPIRICDIGAEGRLFLNQR